MSWVSLERPHHHSSGPGANRDGSGTGGVGDWRSFPDFVFAVGRGIKITGRLNRDCNHFGMAGRPQLDHSHSLDPTPTNPGSAGFRKFTHPATLLLKFQVAPSIIILFQQPLGVVTHLLLRNIGFNI